MRFETVLFDLDGTVVDSGAIILASMRHATREVLGRDYSDEELLQTVGGPGRGADARARARPGRAARGRLPRPQRAAPRRPRACAGMEDVLVRLHEEGRRLGIVTAKRRVTVELAFASIPLGTSSRRSSAGTRPRNKPDPEPSCSAPSGSGGPPRPPTSGSPFDIRRRGGGHVRRRRDVGPDPRPRAARGGTARLRSSAAPRSSLASSGRRPPPPALASCATSQPRAHRVPRQRTGHGGRGVRRPLRRARRAQEEHPELVLPTPTRRVVASRTSSEGQHLGRWVRSKVNRGGAAKVG